VLVRIDHLAHGNIRQPLKGVVPIEDLMIYSDDKGGDGKALNYAVKQVG
jgi:hypothetical protein